MAGVLESTQKRTSAMITALKISTGSRFGLSRTWNAAITKLQTRLGMSYLLGVPRSIAIEVTNRCNSNCVLCPVGEGRLSRPRGNMSWDNFRRLIDEVNNYVTFVGLYNWGEPLLHPRIYDMIEYVTTRNIHASISTNLHCFSVKDGERLVGSGLNSLGVALHGLSQQTYSTYQPGKNLDAFIDKVKAIVDAKHRLKSNNPDIRLDFIVRKDNEDEAENLAAFAKSLGVGYLLEEVSLNLRFLGQDSYMKPRDVDEQTLRKERLMRIEHWCPSDESKVNPVYRWLRRNGGRMPGGEHRLFRCTFPWHHIIVCWDGDVNLCCGSFERKHSVGNVFKESVRKVWNGELYQAARRSIRSRRRKSDPWVLCNECPGGLL